MKTLIFIALGGMFGALARHGAGVAAVRIIGHGFPYATMAVNILGSILMGVIVGYGMHSDISYNAKMFLMVGLLGAFTTFSTFSLDAVNLLQKGEWLQASSYILISVVLGILGLIGGISLGKMAGAL